MPNQSALPESSVMSAVPTLPTRNPRTGRPDHDMPVFDAAAVRHVAQRLRAAQPAWAARPLAERLQVLQRFAAALLQDQPELVAALTQDTGRQAESVLEVLGTVGTIRRWIDDAPALLADPPPRPSRTPHIRIEQRRHPYGVAGIVSPWNFPLLLSLIDAIPALAAGCAVLVKPSEATPRFVPVLEGCIARVPELAEVLRFVTGAGATGQAVVQHSDVLCFTGSVRTGRRVAQLAAEVFIPAHLELGGKDAAIVCADADLPRAARAIAWGSMGSAGQSCMSIERCYVERSAHDRFVELLVAEVGALRHALPAAAAGADNAAQGAIKAGQTGEIGPIIAALQVPIVERHLAEALAQGARAVTGGAVIEHGGGAWCQPTVLVGATHRMSVVTEETFAAVLPVMPFDSDDEAVALANDSDFGLSGCVFSQDIDRARRIAERLQAGAVSINDAALTAMVYDAPKQSFKASGLGGSRMGAPSLQRFYRVQALLISDGAASPWWFPPRG